MVRNAGRTRWENWYKNVWGQKYVTGLSEWAHSVETFLFHADTHQSHHLERRLSAIRWTKWQSPIAHQPLFPATLVWMLSVQGVTVAVAGSLSAPNPPSILYSLCDAGAGLLWTLGPHFSFVSWPQLALPTGDARRRLKGKRKKGLAPSTSPISFLLLFSCLPVHFLLLWASLQQQQFLSLVGAESTLQFPQHFQYQPHMTPSETPALVGQWLFCGAGFKP